MKLIRYFIIVLLTLISFSSVYSLSSTSNDAYWTFDGVLTDSTGNGRTLTNSGATYTGAGLINGAYLYDGVNDYMSNTDPVNSGSYYTISTWVYLGEEADANQKYLIMSRDPVTTTNVNYYLYLPSTNDYVTLGYNDGSWQNCQDTSLDLVASTWYHIVATFNTDTNEVKIYRNGALTKTCSGLTGTPIATGSQNQYLGSDRGSSNYFSGYLDEVSLWTRTLNLTEVQELYNGGAGFQYPYAAGTTPSIQSNTSNYYENIDVSIYLNTSSNVNMSYVLNGGAETSICNDCNSTTLNLTLIDNSTNTIIFISNDIYGEKNITDTTIVNPYQYFRVYDTTSSSYLQNYTLNSISSINDYVYFRFRDIGTGLQSLEFNKLGYPTQDYNYSFDITSPANYTFNITPSKIILNIYDRDTNDYISGSTTSITLVASTGYNTTTTTGQVNITDINFIEETYIIIAENSLYQTESVYFTFDNREILNVNMYLIKANQTNLGYLTSKTITDIGQLIQGSICSLLEWKADESAYITTAQGSTNVNGEVNLNIELGTKLYKVTCTKNGASQTSTAQIFTTTGQVVPLILETLTSLPTNNFEGVTYSLTNSTYNSTHQRITYTFSDSANLVTQACLKIYEVHGTKITQLQSSCVASSTGEIQLVQNINNTFNVIAVADVTIDTTTTELDSISFKGISALSKSLEDYGLDIIIPLVFVILGVAIGFMVVPQNIYISAISTIVLTWFSVVIVPSIISVSIATFVTFISVIIIWGGFKPK